MTLTGSTIAASARAGIAGFGAYVSVLDTTIECAAFPLAAEPSLGLDAVFDDLGGNSCGCQQETKVCKAASAELQPPEPLEPYQ